MSRAVDILIGRTYVVGRRPLLPVYLRMSPLWMAALGFRDEDFRADDGGELPEGASVTATGTPDPATLTALQLVCVGLAAPTEFPTAKGVRWDADPIAYGDAVQHDLMVRGLDGDEIRAVVEQGGAIYRQLQDELGALTEARKRARGNSGAPAGASSTGAT